MSPLPSLLTIRPRIAALLLACAVLPGTAHAQNRYALLHVDNQTKDLNIPYQVRWGENAEWGKEVKLEAGKRWNHWYAYEKPDQNRSPVPQITFNSGIGKARSVVTYNLEAFARPTNQDGGGKLYAFIKKTDASGEQYVELIVAGGDAPVAKAPPKGSDPAAKIATSLYDEGIKSLADKDFTKAVEWFTQALKASPNFPEAALAHNNLGVIQLQQGKSETAVNEFTQAIAIDVRNPLFFSNRGAAYYKRGQFSLAVRNLDYAVRVNPKLAAAYRWRAQANAKLGQIELAREDYYKAVNLDAAQEELFEVTSFLVNRQEALRALEAFQMGSTLTPKALAELNNFPGGEPIGLGDGEMSGNVKELIAQEKTHLRALEHEMVAAANILFRAAKMSPDQLAAKGLKLGWMFGPVTAPNNRNESKDGLAGLRVIGRLEFPDGKEINSIAALKFYPAKEDSEEEGKIGLLSDLDNFRLEVRLFDLGSIKSDYAFQSFRVATQGTRLRMQPGFYLDMKTGGFVSKDLVFTALGTNCINCHLSGPKFKAAHLALMQKKDYPAMEGFKDFLDQMKHWSASKTMRGKMEELMKANGPAAFLPIDAMLAANQEHWISIYPRYVERGKTPGLGGRDSAAGDARTRERD